MKTKAITAITGTSITVRYHTPYTSKRQCQDCDENGNKKVSYLDEIQKNLYDVPVRSADVSISITLCSTSFDSFEHIAFDRTQAGRLTIGLMQLMESVSESTFIQTTYVKSYLVDRSADFVLRYAQKSN